MCYGMKFGGYRLTILLKSGGITFIAAAAPTRRTKKTTKKDTNTDEDQTTRRDAKQHEKNVELQKGLKPETRGFTLEKSLSF